MTHEMERPSPRKKKPKLLCENILSSSETKLTMKKFDGSSDFGVFLHWNGHEEK